MSVARIREPDIETRIYRVEDLDWLRDVRDFGVELIDGEVWMTPSPNTGHQTIVGELHAVLREAVQLPRRGRVFLSPLDVVLDDLTAVVPDLSVVLADRLDIVRPERIEGVPSLVVEIVSPSSRRADAVVKRDRYARAGVPEYWLFDPVGRTAVRYSDPADGSYASVSLLNHDDTLVSATIPGLRVDLAPVFAGIGPA